MRRAVRRDNSEKPIVAALEAAGAIVLKRLPVDLLVYYKGSWRLLEAKTPKASRSPAMLRRQKEQAAFIKAFGIPVVTEPASALAAIGATPLPTQGVSPDSLPPRRQTGFHVIPEFETP